MRSGTLKSDDPRNVITEEKEASASFPKEERMVGRRSSEEDVDGWCKKIKTKRAKKVPVRNVLTHHHHGHHEPEHDQDANVEPPPIPSRTLPCAPQNTHDQNHHEQERDHDAGAEPPPPPIPPRTLPGAYREGGTDDDDNETMFPTPSIVSSSHQQAAHAANSEDLISAQLVTDPVAAIYVPPQDPVVSERDSKSACHHFLSKYWKQLVVLLALVLGVGLVLGVVLSLQPVEPSPAETPAPSTVAPSSPMPSIPAFPSSLPPTEPPLAWTPLGQILHGKSEGDQFGNSVSLSYDGTVLAVGCDGEGYVRVYQYHKDENEWKQRGHDIEGGPESASFGVFVSLSADGTTLAVGDQYGGCCGQLHVYQWTAANQDDNLASSWSRVGQVIDGDVENGELGVSVSLSADGRVVATGAWMANYVRVYHLRGDTWTQLGRDLTGEEGSIFGESISLSSDGSTLAVGAPLSATMHIYSLVDDSWVQVGQTLNGDTVSSDEMFGFSVSLSANGTIASCTDTQRIRVFSFRKGDGLWMQVGSDMGVDGENWYGSVLSPDGSTVGCEGSMKNTSYSYSVFRVYSFTNNSWSRLGEELIVQKDYGRDDQRRVSLSENGTVFAFGESKVVDGGGAGTARVYAFL